MSEVYDFTILYHQLIVCDPTTAPIPNNWQERHVAQGFSWRLGTVFFSTLGDLGSLRVEVLVGGELGVRPDAVRATVVPFCVSPPGLVELSDTASEETTRVAGASMGRPAPEARSALRALHAPRAGIDLTSHCSLTQRL